MKRVLLSTILLFFIGEVKGQESEKVPLKELDSVENNNWSVGTYYDGDYPVIMKFVNELPKKEKMTKLPFLTVISWPYDGADTNGMPSTPINTRMIRLEDVIEEVLITSEMFTAVYSRTGNNLKELVYYCSNQPDFMAMLNEVLAGHDAYPIEITFYPDKEWSDYKKIKEIFK